MQVIEIESPGELDELITRLWELGTTGIVEHESSVQAVFPDTADISELIAKYTCRIIEQAIQSPAAAISQASDPILAGERFFIVDSSSQLNPPSGRIRVAINAQNAFGSGSHESTQLVIRALEEHMRPADLVFDVGSGSGILSAVALHLGARNVFACDTHLDSVLLTRCHAPGAHVFAGSIDSVSAESADVVLANISARIIDTLAGHLTRIAKPNGLLILAGFIADQPPKFLVPYLVTRMNEWCCWLCRPGEISIERNSLPEGKLQPFAAEWW